MNKIVVEVEKVVKDKIKKYMDETELKNDSSLVDYGIDSILLIEIVIGLESEFDIVIDDDDLQENIFKSINTIAEYITNKMDRGM